MDNDQHKYLELTEFSCQDVELLLDAYLDRELISELSPRFQTHLDECENCSLLVNDCRDVIDVAKTLNSKVIPTDVSSRLREALRERVGFEPKPHVRLQVIK